MLRIARLLGFAIISCGLLACGARPRLHAPPGVNPDSPLWMTLTVAEPAPSNAPVWITLRFYARHVWQDATVTTILPPEITLVAGATSWYGNLVAGDVVEQRLRIAVQSYEFPPKIIFQVEGESIMYELEHGATSETFYLNAIQDQVVVSKIPLYNDPTPIIGTAVLIPRGQIKITPEPFDLTLTRVPVATPSATSTR